jgi:hypothetical protein
MAPPTFLIYDHFIHFFYLIVLCLVCLHKLPTVLSLLSLVLDWDLCEQSKMPEMMVYLIFKDIHLTFILKMFLFSFLKLE